MLSFFHGWRRKAACVTLVAALVFTFWWVRSCSICDVIYLREKNQFLNTYLFEIATFFDSEQVNIVASDGSSIHWLRRLDRNPQSAFYETFPAGGDVLEHMTPQANVSNAVLFVQIPYSAIVVPLSLLSVWLMLSKPRKKHFSEPTPTDVA